MGYLGATTGIEEGVVVEDRHRGGDREDPT